MALPQVLDTHGLANEDPSCLHNVPMYDKLCIWYFYEKKRMSTNVRTAGDTHSSNFLVRLKAQGKVARLEIKNQTYEKLRQRHKKVKPFKCQGVLLPQFSKRRALRKRFEG